MQEAQFMRYERISDTLYTLGNGLLLRMNVSLAFYDKKNHNRKFFYNEYEYTKENMNVVTIRRNYDYYLSIDNTNSSGGMLITVRDFPRFRDAIGQAASWFRDRKWNRLYARGNGKLVLVAPIPEIRQSGFLGGKQLSIDPVVIQSGVGLDDSYPGVRLAIGVDQFANMNVDTLMGLEYLVNSINMIQLAQTMLASIPVPDRTELLRKSFGDSDRGEGRRVESTHSNTDETLGKTVIGRKIGGSNGILE